MRNILYTYISCRNVKRKELYTRMMIHSVRNRALLMFSSLFLFHSFSPSPLSFPLDQIARGCVCESDHRERARLSNKLSLGDSRRDEESTCTPVRWKLLFRKEKKGVDTMIGRRYALCYAIKGKNALFDCATRDESAFPPINNACMMKMFNLRLICKLHSSPFLFLFVVSPCRRKYFSNNSRGLKGYKDLTFMGNEGLCVGVQSLAPRLKNRRV